jgi:hypothetical protein
LDDIRMMNSYPVWAATRISVAQITTHDELPQARSV